MHRQTTTPEGHADAPTTRDLFNRLKSLSGKETAYSVAKHYGWNANTVRRWEKGHSSLDDDHVEQVAHILGLDPGYVAFCVVTERMKSTNLAIQMRNWLAQHSSAAIVVLAVFLGSFAGFTHAQAPALSAAVASGACILCSIAARPRQRTRKTRANLRHLITGWPPVGFLRSL